MLKRVIATIAAALLVVFSGSQSVRADDQSVADFYRGKVIKFVLSAGEGGGYGTYVETIIPFMQQYLPGNPKIVPQHMLGAGGLVAANNLYNVLPRDGSVFAMIHRFAVSTAALFDQQNVRFDPTKFGWIGSMNEEKSLCAAWHTAPVKTFDDLKKTPIIVSGLAPGGDIDTYTNLLNNVFGTKMKLVTGYSSGSAMDLAIERGEVQGRCGWSWSTLTSTKASWVTEKKVIFLVQMALEKQPELPDVPLIMDFAQTDEQRKILNVILLPELMGRPVMAPPKIPPERLEALRAAFDASMADPKFQERAKLLNLEVSAVSGKRLEEMVNELFATPRPIVDKAKAAVQNNNL
jgi:tripartite-type tricarboxylate transporter receptor subunit TctC